MVEKADGAKPRPMGFKRPEVRILSPRLEEEPENTAFSGFSFILTSVDTAWYPFVIFVHFAPKHCIMPRN